MSRRRHVKRYHPPGTSPGTVSVPAAGSATMTFLVYGPDGLREHEVADVGEARAHVRGDARGWLRIIGHDPAVLQQLADHFGVHPLVLEDVVNLGQRPKVEDYDRYLFVVVDVLRPNGGGVDEHQVSLLLFDHMLVSIEERPSELFRLVEERLRSNHGKMRRMGVDYLAYALVDAAVDHYFPLLEAIGQRIEGVEDEILSDATREGVGRLHAVRGDLLRLRKTAWPLRDMVAALSRTDSRLVAESTHLWLRDVYDHTIQIIDIVETFREMTAGLLDVYLSAVSNRMNEIMKVLTVIATIFIPLTFIVGVYGMNFRTDVSRWNMPELTWRWGYPAVWLVMMAIAGGMLLMFKRRRWF